MSTDRNSLVIFTKWPQYFRTLRPFWSFIFKSNQRMKKIIYFLPVLLLALACTPKVKPVEQAVVTPVIEELKLATFYDSVSYYLGSNSAQQLKNGIPKSFTFNTDLYQDGLKDGFEDKGMISEEDGSALITRFQTEMQAAAKAEQEAAAAEAKKAGEAFLTDNAAKEGVMTTDSGLQYKILQEGTGASPTASDRVKVHYEGRLIDGTVFDSSIKRGEPVDFGVGQVISGWTEGLQLMKEGAKYQFFIPAKLAYGERGAGGKIGPGATLIFDVELIEVLK